MENIMQQNQEKYNFLIDGFPRNKDNLQGWEKDMEGKADVRFILFFDCSNEVIEGWWMEGWEEKCKRKKSYSMMRMFLGRSFFH